MRTLSLQPHLIQQFGVIDLQALAAISRVFAQNDAERTMPPRRDTDRLLPASCCCACSAVSSAVATEAVAVAAASGSSLLRALAGSTRSLNRDTARPMLTTGCCCCCCCCSDCCGGAWGACDLLCSGNHRLCRCVVASAQLVRRSHRTAEPRHTVSTDSAGANEPTQRTRAPLHE